MANALNGLGSAPFAGLGTASYTVTVAGLHTMEIKSFVPYASYGDVSARSLPVRQVQQVTVVADSSGSLNSKYFTFSDAGDAHSYYVWYDINSAGVDPAVAGKTGIKVSAATDVTANDLATATRSAINGVSGISVVASGATDKVVLSNTYPGTASAAANGAADPGFSYTISTAGSWGDPPVSGLVIVLKKNSDVLQVSANPTPTQPILGAKTVVNCAANDVLSFVLSSSSPADNAIIAVKSIINIYLGE